MAVDTVQLANKALSVVPDSVSAAQMLADSIAVQLQDTVVAEAVKGTLEKPAFSGARDSVVEDMSNGRKILYYYGDVQVKYGDMELKSDYMAYDLESNTVLARGTKDFDGNWVGLPEMKMGETTYTMEQVYYNFNSRKAKIKNMKTQQKEGELRGENLKLMPDMSVNIAGGKYTVCDADHPHYYLQMTAAKLMTKPTQKTVFGPAYVVIEDVPLPLALPFGFVPQKPERASGLLMPTYGDETARGLYLRDLGYYFVIGDHFDISLTGDIYSYGSWGVKLTSRYKKRYAFDGSISVNYSVDITGEKGSKDYVESTNFGLNWSHSQDSKARPGTSFRASVNFSSPSNNRFNAQSIDQVIQNQTSSSISYSKTFSWGSFSTNILHSQNSRDSSYSITLPNFTFSVNRLYPFKKKNRVGKEKLYEKISFSYNTTLQNKINFKAKEFMQPGFLNKMQNGMTHGFSISLPQFTLLKYLNFSPTVSYGMNWFFRETTAVYDPDMDKVIEMLSDQFSTFGITQNFSGGISMSTRIYGTFNFNPKGNVKAIRHMITPSVSFSYHPELGTSWNGYTTLNYVNAKGEEKVYEYNRYKGQMYSPPSKGKSASLSFSFGNNIEAKIRDKSDSTGVKTTKLKLLDQLNIGGSYNFLADSLRLSNISISASTTIFGKLGINGNLTLDPYAVNERGVKINKLCVTQLNNFHLARLTNASASLSYSINGAGKLEGNQGQNDAQSGTSGKNPDYYRIYYHPVTGEYIPGGWLYYMNPEVPWSLNFNLNFAYSKQYKYVNESLQVQNNFTQTLSLAGQIRLTKALNFNINTGFDLSTMKMTTTQLNATYDLHCFAITVSWVPNGQWESWSFRIAAKASALSDLLQYKKSSSYWDKD
ncbi:MAG: LPS-assembly protein LptD [Bacteroidales bacterium]|nr:LPS-assembly protein LptD [Bacteroidales bacterium]